MANWVEEVAEEGVWRAKFNGLTYAKVLAPKWDVNRKVRVEMRDNLHTAFFDTVEDGKLYAEHQLRCLAATIEAFLGE